MLICSVANILQISLFSVECCDNFPPINEKQLSKAEINENCETIIVGSEAPIEYDGTVEFRKNEKTVERYCIQPPLYLILKNFLFQREHQV